MKAAGWHRSRPTGPSRRCRSAARTGSSTSSCPTSPTPGYLKIVVLTQYKSHSLDRHISQTWRFSTLLGNYVTPVPAQMRRGPHWFSGSADAIYQNLNLISDERPDIVCVFGADHIYHMDPRQMVEHHVASGAGVTVAAIPVPIGQAHQFGIIDASADGKIVDFLEKPPKPPPMPDDPTRSLASMGNYVFDTDVLVDIVSPTRHRRRSHRRRRRRHPGADRAGVAHMYDFSTNEIPGQADHERGYWRDVGSLDAYYDANMDLIAPVPPFSLYNRDWPVYSLQLPLPPAKVDYGRSGEHGEIANSLLCAGSIVSGGIVERSIIGPEIYVDTSAEVTDSIIFPGVRIGPGARLHRCVIDKNVVIPAGRSDRPRCRGRPRRVRRSAIVGSSSSRRTARSPDRFANGINGAHSAIHARERGDADAQCRTGHDQFDGCDPADPSEIACADRRAGECDHDAEVGHVAPIGDRRDRHQERAVRTAAVASATAVVLSPVRATTSTSRSPATPPTRRRCRPRLRPTRSRKPTSTCG